MYTLLKKSMLLTLTLTLKPMLLTRTLIGGAREPGQVCEREGAQGRGGHTEGD